MIKGGYLGNRLNLNLFLIQRKMLLSISYTFSSRPAPPLSTQPAISFELLCGTLKRGSSAKSTLAHLHIFIPYSLTTMKSILCRPDNISTNWRAPCCWSILGGIFWGEWAKAKTHKWNRSMLHTRRCWWYYCRSQEAARNPGLWTHWAE